MDHDLVKFTGIFSAVVVGFFIGMRHSLDGDHVVAVSTMAKDIKSFFNTIWIGFSWGLGHSTPLIIIGLLVLTIRDSIIEFYEPISEYFELLVALMLIFLGLQVFWKLYRGNFHFHKHEHDGVNHMHVHNSHAKNSLESKNHNHNIIYNLLSFFRIKSYLIGTIHGLAGSAAVILAILPTSPSFISGFSYLIFFCLGTIVSMTLMTFLIATPFVIRNGSDILQKILISFAGILSIFLGFALGSDLLFDSSFTDVLWY